MSDPTYITQQDFYRYCKDVKPFLSSNRPLRSWIGHSGDVHRAEQTGNVEVLFRNGEDLGTPEDNLAAVDADGEWFYDSAIDRTYIFDSANDPDDLDMQAGEDFVTFFDAMAEQASRLIDSAAAYKRQIPFTKDEAGNFDEQIIQITSYKMAEILTIVKAPQISERYQELLMNDTDTGLLDKLINGKLKLLQDVILESSRGKIREVGTIAGGFRLTETRGVYHTMPWDLLKIICSTAGIRGTAKIKVFGFDPNTDTQKSKELTPSGGETVSGVHIPLASGLQGLFEGADNASMTLNDEWEIEVRWPADRVTNPTISSIPIGRGGFGHHRHGHHHTIQSVTE